MKVDRIKTYSCAQTDRRTYVCRHAFDNISTCIRPCVRPSVYLYVRSFVYKQFFWRMKFGVWVEVDECYTAVCHMTQSMSKVKVMRGSKLVHSVQGCCCFVLNCSFHSFADSGRCRRRAKNSQGPNSSSAETFEAVKQHSPSANCTNVAR